MPLRRLTLPRWCREYWAPQRREIFWRAKSLPGLVKNWRSWRRLRRGVYLARQRVSQWPWWGEYLVIVRWYGSLFTIIYALNFLMPCCRRKSLSRCAARYAWREKGRAEEAEMVAQCTPNKISAGKRRQLWCGRN